MILLSLIVLISATSRFNILIWDGWLELDWSVSFVQLMVIFSVWRLFFMKNNYQLVGYSFLFVLSISMYLFFLQLDVFACFLLVSECIVLLFVLTMLIHLNSTNLLNPIKTRNLTAAYIFVFISFLFNTWSFTYYNYFVDWYAVQDSTYNDLIAQYIYFYSNKVVVILIGYWLLLVTFILVAITLSCFSVHADSDVSSFKKVIFVRKSQSTWKQWYTKPITRFFK